MNEIHFSVWFPMSCHRLNKKISLDCYNKEAGGGNTY